MDEEKVMLPPAGSLGRRGQGYKSRNRPNTLGGSVQHVVGRGDGEQFHGFQVGVLRLAFVGDKRQTKTRGHGLVGDLTTIDI